eukprot:768033-Hanusia_phi.AAC.12
MKGHRCRMYELTSCAEHGTWESYQHKVGSWQESSSCWVQRDESVKRIMLQLVNVAAMAPTREDLLSIASKTLRPYFAHFSTLPDVLQSFDLIVRSVVLAVEGAGSVLPPCRSHQLYLFELPALIELCRGLCLCSMSEVRNKREMIQLFLHECKRTFIDKLSSQSDRDGEPVIVKFLNSLTSKHLYKESSDRKSRKVNYFVGDSVMEIDYISIDYTFLPNHIHTTANPRQMSNFAGADQIIEEEEEDQDADSENGTATGAGAIGSSFHADMFSKTQSEIHHYYSICKNRDGLISDISTSVKMSLSELCEDPAILVRCRP